MSTGSADHHIIHHFIDIYVCRDFDASGFFEYGIKSFFPLKNMSSIEYDPENEIDGDLSDVSLFEDVEDSAAYIRELRKNAWRK